MSFRGKKDYLHTVNIWNKFKINLISEHHGLYFNINDEY